MARSPVQTPAQRGAPRRTCVSCRTERDKRDLVRLVRTADGDVRLDPTGKASGRGAYLCADPACWSTALKSRPVQRALDVSSSSALDALLAGGPPAGRVARSTQVASAGETTAGVADGA